MTRKPADYSCTLIYKITCKDPLIKDIYVGHTTNFVQRRDEHKRGSIQNSCKLYEVIRANGGWTNWTMEIIHYFSCKDLKEAKTKEQEYFVALQATLNSVEPMGGEKKEKEKKEKVKKYLEKVKEIIPENDIDTNVLIKTTKYECKMCEYNTCRLSQYERHLSTTKHIKRNNSKKVDNNYVCKICSKQYKDRSGLWKHKKICVKLEENNNQTKFGNLVSNENTELNNIIGQLIKSNYDLQKQLAEVFNITK
jgi:predicted GIY-YIG superfamily endonuclease